MRSCVAPLRHLLCAPFLFMGHSQINCQDISGTPVSCVNDAATFGQVSTALSTCVVLGHAVMRYWVWWVCCGAILGVVGVVGGLRCDGTPCTRGIVCCCRASATLEPRVMFAFCLCMYSSTHVCERHIHPQRRYYPRAVTVGMSSDGSTEMAFVAGGDSNISRTYVKQLNLQTGAVSTIVGLSLIHI